ncbi:hypothetical protein [Thalassotalea piscium]|uniref:Uncharacterized protein n=1 Tax=Thalassotalea piscium TaxID=1230533 RepID=A0A7X0NK60_9GAMM|nr:hypothetical protein [Thalassotalea piscium]MBB6544806.1 hypothetical protein [Thalassotalea piscium]
MTMIITLEQRIAKIKTLEDVDIELTRAKKYAMGFRTKAKNASTLAEKLALGEKQKQAEKVLRQLRMAIWDIEDDIRPCNAFCVTARFK